MEFSCPQSEPRAETKGKVEPDGALEIHPPFFSINLFQ